MKKVIEIAALDLTLHCFMQPLMKRLQKEGWQVQVAAADTGYLQSFENEGYKVYRLNIKRKIVSIANVQVIFGLIKLFLRERPDVVHVHTPIAAVLVRIAAKIARVPVVIYTLHGLIHKTPFIQVEKVMCRYFTDYIMTVNKEDTQYLIENQFIGSEYVRNINSVGIDTKAFNLQSIDEVLLENEKRALGINGEFVIGFVGRLVKEKGVCDLLEAFIHIKQKHTNCKLLLIGSAGFGERDKGTVGELKARINQKNIIDDVIFAGHREDIPLILSMMDVFVLPSYREGMPVSSLEAMSMERPVIVTDIRGAREEVDENTGKVVSPGDVDALAREIEWYIEHPNERVIIGKNARDRVKKLYSIEKVVEKEMEFFTRNF